MKPKNIFIGICVAGAVIYLTKTIHHLILLAESDDTTVTSYGFILIELIAIAMPFYLVCRKMKIGLVLMYIVGIATFFVLVIQGFSGLMPDYLVVLLAIYWAATLGLITVNRKKMCSE